MGLVVSGYLVVVYVVFVILVGYGFAGGVCLCVFGWFGWTFWSLGDWLCEVAGDLGFGFWRRRVGGWRFTLMAWVWLLCLFVVCFG